MNPGDTPGSDWRDVMAANWNLVQNVHAATGQVQWPTGPMTVDAGFVARWVDAWIVQGGALIPNVTHTGPSQSTDEHPPFASTTQWTAGNLKWINGRFPKPAGPPGVPALGISILAMRSTATPYEYRYHWWIDLVLLR